MTNNATRLQRVWWCRDAEVFKCQDDSDYTMFVPDRPGNRHRQQIDDFEAAGGTIEGDARAITEQPRKTRPRARTRK